VIGGNGGNGGDGMAVAGLGGDAGGGEGGGLRSLAGTLTLIDSTVASNRAVGGNGGKGGFTVGIGPGGAGGTGGSGFGGGVATDACQLSFRNSTVAFNTAFGGHKGPGRQGGPDGVDGTGTGGGVSAGTLLASAHASTSSLFGGNTADTNPDFSGTFDTVDRTLVANGQGAGGIINGINGNLVGVGDPLLGQLADNGGPTLTVALLPGSPALNHGANPYGLATDQRGQPRLRDGQADIGAYEFQVPLPAVPPPLPQFAARLVHKKGKFLVLLTDGTGALRVQLRFPFRVQLLRQDVNGDGVLDIVVLFRQGHRLRRLAFSGRDLSRLPT
jgi:hypothetical protein